MRPHIVLTESGRLPIVSLSTGERNRRLLSLRYMEDEANDRGLNHEDTS